MQKCVSRKEARFASGVTSRRAENAGPRGLADRGDKFRKKSRGALLAIAKGTAELAADEEEVGQGAEWAERKGVFKLVREARARLDGSIRVGARLGPQTVAVAPGFKGAAMLDVAEVIVPGELGDFGVPGKADGDER